ncbi:cytochrome c-type biogenesis protein [Halorhodospira halophila]|uniref:Cytochrome c-type biogenesis protein n=1 Tax=Halorhodospira halophila (strain DSM 244 / SL1) TaxID=349124 RepID=A1WWS6_HALHL|nr:cytochrome c-type biogenesis protein [Halorhodospira halophila]ABM62138.1 cytochrome C biogenesis protein [Halorhodospira halophila SL1]MBK1729466.1 cytochrome c-type biogenesis protein CcmH [Halorhodospira halophila]
MSTRLFTALQARRGETPRGLRELLVALFLLAGAAMAAPAGAVSIGEPLEFETEEQEEQYYTLVRQLRCTVCQTETIYESPAELAGDMRRRVYEMTVDGYDKDEIVDFMTARYGDYVRYNPPLQMNTALLWVSPFLLLVIGGVAWLQVVRHRQQKAAQTDLSESERRALERFRRGD